jgi:Concanavalin A-like lectin/glucanases superfamily
MLGICKTRRSPGAIIAVLTTFAFVFEAGSALGGAYSTAVLADNPVAYYRLGETSGTVAANSSAAGATLDGNYVNFGAAQVSPATPSTLGESGPRPGDPSGSFAIAGFEADNIGIRSGANANAQVEVADNALLDITGALTLEAWVYRDPQAVNGNNEGIVGKFQGSTFGNQRAYCLYYNSRTTAPAPAVGFILNTTGAATGNVDFQTTSDIPLGTDAGWVYLAAVYEPGVRMSVYMNGVSIGEKTLGLPAADIFNSAGPLWIGRQFSLASNTSFEGKVDEVAVYNTALTPEQIAAHYAAAVPEPSGLVLAALGLSGIGMVRVFRWRRGYCRLGSTFK